MFEGGKLALLKKSQNRIEKIVKVYEKRGTWTCFYEYDFVHIRYGLIRFDKIDNIYLLLGCVIITFSKLGPGIAPGFSNVIFESKFVYLHMYNRFKSNET